VTERLYSEVWWERLLFRIRGRWTRRVVQQRLRLADAPLPGVSYASWFSPPAPTTPRHFRGPRTDTVHAEDVGSGIVAVVARCGNAWATSEARQTDDAVTCKSCLRLAG